MTWTVTDQEFEIVVALAAPERYDYWVKRVTDHQQVWTLSNRDGYVLAAAPDGREVLPVWPHERYAKACAAQEWHDCQPRLIEYGDWVNKWLPGMARDDRMVAIFPTPSDQAVVLAPDRLAQDLQVYRNTLLS